MPKVPHSFVGTFTFLLTVYKLLVYFSINNEAMPQLVLDTSVNSEGGTWEEDWDKMVPGKVNRSIFSGIEICCNLCCTNKQTSILVEKMTRIILKMMTKYFMTTFQDLYHILRNLLCNML